MTSTSDEAVDAGGDLTPAWHPKCPQILHPQAVHLAEQRTVGALGTLTLQSSTVKREGFIITGLKEHSCHTAPGCCGAERAGKGTEGFVGVLGPSPGERGRQPEGLSGEKGEGKERGGVCVTVQRNRIHGNFLPDA